MKIVTDSAVDLPEEMFAQFGIERMPLLISFGKEMLRSGIDIGPEEFYKRLAASGDNIPTTSQPSPGEFADLYRRVGATDKDILSIHISSGLSGTINSAIQGAPTSTSRTSIPRHCRRPKAFRGWRRRRGCGAAGRWTRF